jgi:hypothetical protein
MLDSPSASAPGSDQQKWLPHFPFARRGSRPTPESLSVVQMEHLRKRVMRARAATNEIAEELTLTLGVAQRIRAGRCQIDSANKRLNFVLDCLLSNPSKLVEARGERLQLQFDAYRNSGGLTRMLAWLSAGNPTGVLVIALVASFGFWMAVAIAIRWLLDHEINKKLAGSIFFMNGEALAAVSSAAFIGGVVSIAIRLREFSQARDLDPFGLFLTVMFKPLIGVVLSWFLLATLAGEVISIGFLGKDPFSAPQISEKVMYVLWMLGFLAGFSERFAWDFVDRAEGVVIGGFSTEPSTGRNANLRPTSDFVPDQSPAKRKTKIKKKSGGKTVKN